MKFLALSMLLTALSSHASPEDSWVVIDNKVLKEIQVSLPGVKIEQSSEHASVFRFPVKNLSDLSSLIHHKLHRCGGFSSHDSLPKAQKSLTKLDFNPFRRQPPAINAAKEIQHELVAGPLVDQLEEIHIREMIIKLSSFPDRFHSSQNGVNSSRFIGETWTDLTKHRSDVKLETITHRDWKQPSLILTIEGSEKPSEVVIIGGHIDSISDSHFAPGADDNASGVATITEVLRILMLNDFKPKKTIKFMGYAAEEVGLKGSAEIAKTFKAARANVIGVIQFDMTLFQGTKKKDIMLVSDYTSSTQNAFLGKLIDKYVQVPWGFTQCGYGCSDHASWFEEGYPASLPFESKFNDANPFIHTKNDVIEKAGGHAEHSLKFAKLGMAYLVEMAN